MIILAKIGRKYNFLARIFFPKNRKIWGFPRKFLIFRIFKKTIYSFENIKKKQKHGKSAEFPVNQWNGTSLYSFIVVKFNFVPRPFQVESID
jgi:hypothetical protein